MDVKAILLNNIKNAPRTNKWGQPVGILMPDWTPRQFPAKTIMEGKFVRLEPLNAEVHTDDLWEAYGKSDADGRDWNYLLADYPPDMTSFKKYIEKKAAGHDPSPYAVINKTTGKVVGMMSYMRVDVDNGTIEIGDINLSSCLRRTVHSTEAVFLMTKRAFDELGYRRYEWKCDSLNEPSVSAALRYGFQFDGIFRNARVYKGRSRDSAWFSIIDTEWPSLRRAFETWLDPANFDSDGKQKIRLADLTATTRQSK